LYVSGHARYFEAFYFERMIPYVHVFIGFRVRLNVLSWSLVAASVLGLWSLACLGYLLAAMPAAGPAAAAVAALGLFLCGLAIGESESVDRWMDGRPST
jgi:hypothetical protein